MQDKGESMNRWTIWTITFIYILDYIQIKNLKPYSKLILSKF